MNKPLAILNSPITFGGFGRNLTSAEVKALRKEGFRLSERWIVVQQGGSEHYGQLYYPVTGGYTCTGTMVTTK